MARLESQKKGGFYATPVEEQSYIAQRLVPAQGLLNIMDPCAGEGVVLKYITDYFQSVGAEPKSFGVELEESRFKKAKTRLYKTIHGGYEELRASNGVFSLIYLNPPYDWGLGGIRTELIFLNDLTAPGKYLQAGGVLCFCIPAATLKYVANLVAIRFSNVRVYRFTDKNYPVFKQVVLYGERKKGRGDPEEVKQIKGMLLAMAEDPSIIPVIDQGDGWTISVPASSGEVTLFRGMNLDPEEVARDIDSMDFDEIDKIMDINENSKTTKLSKPLLPLKTTHIATALAAGVMDRYAGDHYCMGVTRQVTETQSSVDDSGNNRIEIETKRFVSRIRVFSDYGVTELK